MDISAQWWLSLGIQVLVGVVAVAMMRQELKDHRLWLTRLTEKSDELTRIQASLGERIAHVEGVRGLPRGGA